MTAFASLNNTELDISLAEVVLIAHDRPQIEVVRREPDGSWSQTQKLNASDPAAGDVFGIYGGLLGNKLFVGAPGHAVGGTLAGAVYEFDRSGTSWVQTKRIDGTTLDSLGFCLAVAHGYVAVTAPRSDTYATKGGRAFLVAVTEFPTARTTARRSRTPTRRTRITTTSGTCASRWVARARSSAVPAVRVPTSRRPRSRSPRSSPRGPYAARVAARAEPAAKDRGPPEGDRLAGGRPLRRPPQPILVPASGQPRDLRRPPSTIASGSNITAGLPAPQPVLGTNS